MTANLDTKALRALRKDACDLDGKSLMEVLHAQQKYERAVISAAPALLDAAEENERLRATSNVVAVPEEGVDPSKWLRVGPCIVKDMLNERDALRSENERLREALRGLVSEIRIDPTMDSSIRVRGFRQGAADALRVAFKILHADAALRSEKGEVQA